MSPFARTFFSFFLSQVLKLKGGYDSCTIVFFSALAGIGYQEPRPVDSADVSTVPTVAAGQNGGFKFGGPVFDPANDKLHLEKVMAEQRELEEAWARKRRPKDVSTVQSFFISYSSFMQQLIDLVFFFYRVHG